MNGPHIFLMAGGGTGGHVMPALAVARELERRGHHPIFAGTRRGFEANLVPAAGFPIEWIEVGGLKGVGALRVMRTLIGLPVAIAHALRLLAKYRPAAVFSMGGYVAGPVVIAAVMRRIPVVVMEPNAVPGFTNRRLGPFVRRALISFPDTARYFPKGRAEVTGVPVRREFFELAPKPRGQQLTILITGGSRGSRTLNNAARDSWQLIRELGLPVRIIHQTGAVPAHAEIEREFSQSGLQGRVVPFIEDMPAAFAEADLIVCRAGAGAVAELAAAGRPAVLVPFPFATDNHQLHNAQAFQRAGAARLVLDKDMTGECLVREVKELQSDPGLLLSMAANARRLSHPGAAERAADVLISMAEGSQKPENPSTVL